MKHDWQRVNGRHRCPQCGRDSWCLISHEAVLCMRVESEHPIRLRSGETGYIHRISTTRTGTTRMPEREPEPVINCTKIMQEWDRNTLCLSIERMADDLGVSAFSVRSLRVAWSKPNMAWAWPMFDGFHNMIGIRLRSMSGKKWAVRGSHQGIFIPCMEPQEECLICEGPTDTAAAISLGYYAVGRPSCAGGAMHICHLFRRIGIRSAVVISDNDEPGLNGAAMIAKQIRIPSCVLVPPAKDLRAYLNAGGDRTTLDSIIHSQVWNANH